MTHHDVAPAVPAQGRRFRSYSAAHLDELTSRAGLDAAERLAVRAVAAVLPFRTNEYVLESLIDWTAAPDDPIYRLVFPRPTCFPETTSRRSPTCSAGRPASAKSRRQRVTCGCGSTPIPRGSWS
jgi:hypothetical protein